jgi:hypothetical protein
MFQTKIEIPVSDFNISFEDRILAMGSCFAQNIGKKMNDVYFNIDLNPFGVLYNPVSISNSIELLLQKKMFTQDDIFNYRSLWQSYSHSSLFTDTSTEGCLKNINTRLESSGKFMQQTNVILITFGTAWVFEEKKSGRVVSNCHKLPASEFTRRRLTVKEIVDDYTNLIKKLTSSLPDMQFIFSVSPIRHWKDGAHESTISKGTLLLAIDELQQQHDRVHYFPAYEIQMDELRDYRFYASDMLHPSDVAIDYIWKRFSDTYFTKNSIELKKRLEQLNADLSHRPIHPDSLEYKSFLIKTQNRKAELIAEFPFLLNRL